MLKFKPVSQGNQVWGPCENRNPVLFSEEQSKFANIAYGHYFKK